MPNEFYNVDPRSGKCSPPKFSTCRQILKLIFNPCWHASFHTTANKLEPLMSTNFRTNFSSLLQMRQRWPAPLAQWQHTRLSIPRSGVLVPPPPLAPRKKMVKIGTKGLLFITHALFYTTVNYRFRCKPQTSMASDKCLKNSQSQYH